MTRKRFTTALAMLLAAAASLAQIAPEGDPVAARTYAAPGLVISSIHHPLSKLPADLATRLQQQLTALGVSAAYASYDLRAGHWGTLAPGKPLVPGPGVGNTLTWAALGRSAPTTDAAYKQAAWQAFRSWLDANRTILGVDGAELGSPVLSSYENRRLVHMSANRVVNGIAVRQSFVQATLINGNLVLYGSYNWAPIGVSTTPAISADQAKQFVQSHLGSFRVTAWRRSELVLYPFTSGDASPANEGHGYSYRLAWALAPQVARSFGGWEAIVDALGGELLAFYDTNEYLDQKKVVGSVYPISNDGQAPNGVPDGVEQSGLPMSRAYVFDSSGRELQANSEGLVSVDGQYSTNLTGPFVRIVDTCGEASEATSCNALDLNGGPGTDCAVPAGHSAGDTHSARTGFYEVNRLIDQAKSWLGAEANANTPAGWLNRQLPANMNLDLHCNAFFTPLDLDNPSTGSINFYQQGTHPTRSDLVCRNTGEIAAVFDHEWGHGFDTYDNSPGVSLPAEAYADMTAIHRLNQSCIGRGFWLENPLGGVCGGDGDPCTQCTGVREADWKKRQSGRPHDIDWILGQNATVPGSCPASPVSTQPISPTPFNSGPCLKNTHCEGSVVTEVIWDLLKRDLPCQGLRWESFSGGSVYGGRCTGGAATTIDENSALVLGTRLFYLAAGGISMGFQCDPSVGGCTAGSWYLNYLAADDDDGLLADGTPHMVAINDAFVRHQMACPPQAPPAGVMNFGCVGTPAPTVKSTVTATAGIRSATITWTPVAGAGEYWVLRTDGVHGCNLGKTRVATIGSLSPLTYTENDLLDGHTYYYSITSVGGAAGVGIDSCAGAMSDCAAVTPLAPNAASGPGLTVQQKGTPIIENGDGDPFVDNCESAKIDLDVVNSGGVGLTGIKIIAIQPSASGTQILTPLPIAVANLPHGCGAPDAATSASFHFTAGGLASQSTLTFQVTVTANELSAPVTSTIEVPDAESDWTIGNATYSFENDLQGWTVKSGTFSRTNTGGGANGLQSWYVASSAGENSACDEIRSPRMILTPNTTLSLSNQFATEPDSQGFFYDRANVGIVEDATGTRTVVAPDSGRTYNASGGNPDDNACTNLEGGWASAGPAWMQSTWSPAALGVANLAGIPVRFSVRYGTDTLSSLVGFWFDEVTLTNVLLPGPDGQADACPKADFQVTNISATNSKPKEGDRVTVTATVTNRGNLGAAASKTEFLLDGATVLGLADTGALAAGASVDVSIPWNTQGVKGSHVIKVTADRTGLVAESNENNNAGNYTVTVQGNKVKNGSFEQPNSAGNGPDGWSGSSTGAGSATWSDGGSDGAKSAGTSGNGGNATTSGSPSWTSDPIAVAAGQVLTLAVSVSSVNASSAPTAGLLYLGAAGNVLQTVDLIAAPLTTSEFAKLQQQVTIPAGVAQVRVKLLGFSPADLRTSGTVKFDEVGLFAN